MKMMNIIRLCGLAVCGLLILAYSSLTLAADSGDKSGCRDGTCSFGSGACGTNALTKKCACFTSCAWGGTDVTDTSDCNASAQEY